MRYLNTKAAPPSVDAGARTARFIITDDTVDRVREIVRLDAWDFSEWLDNPIWLAFHRPVQPIGTGSPPRLQMHPKTGRRAWASTLTFAPDGASPWSDAAWALVSEGVIRTSSVGFEGTGRTNPTPAEERRGARFVITGAKLREVSVVSVPANPSAVALECQLDRLVAKGLLCSDAREAVLRSPLEHAREALRLELGRC